MDELADCMLRHPFATVVFAAIVALIDHTWHLVVKIWRRLEEEED